MECVRRAERMSYLGMPRWMLSLLCYVVSCECRLLVVCLCLEGDDVTNSDIVVGDTNECKGTKLDCPA